MAMSLDQMHIFAAAANAKSFSETARRLHKAQSAVSTAISDLEDELGVQLFDRTHRYPLLTPAGSALLAEVEAVLLHCGSLKERANALASKLEPRVAIALEEAFPCSAIAPVLAGFQRQCPEVCLDLLQPDPAELVGMVLQGDAMLGLGCARAHYPREIGFCRLGQVTLANVARHDHPLARASRVRFAALADHLQLVLSGQTGHLLTSEYLKSPRQWQVQSQVALLELLRQGLGWAIVPRRLVAPELASGALVELQLEAYPHTQWIVGLDLLWKVAAKPGLAVAWLKAELMRGKVCG